METIISITSQGQLAIPMKIRRQLGITTQSKAAIKVENNKIVITPKSDFWSLAGSLKSDITLSDKELREAREEFGKRWAE